MTRACEYSCTHCRASSIDIPDSNDLKFEEIKNIIEQIQEINNKCVIILTGGDPILSPHFISVIKYLNMKRIRYSVSPPASPLLNFELLDFLNENGMGSLSMSIDGTPAVHDSIRRKKGSFQDTTTIIRMAKDLGINVQVNSTVMLRNFLDFPSILKTLLDLNVNVWEIFFLINVGRGISEKPINGEQFEDFLRFLYGVESNTNINIRTVEGPEYRRVRAQLYDKDVITGGKYFDQMSSITQKLTGIEIRGKNKTPENGKRIRTMFVSSDGNVMISGLFPYILGNVRNDKLKEIIENPILTKLSEQKNYIGKCRDCEYFEICGGSRARAYLNTSDPLESDPICLYNPIKIL
ncbi:radical SAM protein [Cuniculiplasma sp. SKW3]